MSDSERRQHAQVAKLTQLLLMGDSWREVRRTMNLQTEFTYLLNLAVEKAHGEALLDPQIGQLGPAPLGRMLRAGVRSQPARKESLSEWLARVRVERGRWVKEAVEREAERKAQTQARFAADRSGPLPPRTQRKNPIPESPRSGSGQIHA
jgi:hypothetical protein